MYVIKRSGIHEPIHFDKITRRISKLLYGGLDKNIDPAIITQKICSQIYSGITTTELDNLTSRICMNLLFEHPDFGILGGRIAISNHQKNTPELFSEVVRLLSNNKDLHNDTSSLVNEEFIAITKLYENELQNMLDYSRDYLIDFFGFKTLERSYLLKTNNGSEGVKKIIERPQHLFLRVAIGIHGNDLENIKKTYDAMSTKQYTHATPTLFNAGCNIQQLASCFDKNTLVNTLRGAIPIKDVEIGDEVITHLGNVKKVSQIHQNKINGRKLYEVDIKKTNKFIVTEDHKLFVYNKITKKTTWKEIAKLSKNDYVMIPKYEGDILESFIDMKEIIQVLSFEPNMRVVSTLDEKYENFSMKELRKIAKVRGYKFYTSFSKEKLINMFQTEKEREITVFQQFDEHQNLIGEYETKTAIAKALKTPKKKFQNQKFNKVLENNIELYGYFWKKTKIVKAYSIKSSNDILGIDNNIEQYFTITDNTHSNLNDGQSITASIKSTPINRFIKINEDFCKLLGIWYGDGHILTKKDKITGIGFTIHKDNHRLIEFCTNMKEHFGIEHVSIHNMKSQNVIQVLYNCPLLGLLFEKLYGKGFDGKKIHPEIFKYDNKLVYALISGIITTDGCISKNGTISLSMSNKGFMYDLYSLCRLHNIDVCSVRKGSTNKLTKHQTYEMSMTSVRHLMTNVWKTYIDNRIEKTKLLNEPMTIVEQNGFKFVQFVGRKEVEIDDEFVYTLGIEDDHSYSIEGIIAQNCFLSGIEDSIEGIFDTYKDCGMISKFAGGIGVHISNIRSKGSYIRKTGGNSSGLMPLLKSFNSIARQFDQGGRRLGSFAMYLEVHHADIFTFLDAKKNHGAEEERARDLFYALWVCDLFMQCVEKDEDWFLMDPNICSNLNEVYGEEYNILYYKYVREGKFAKMIKARDLWKAIIASQIETGTPYICYKDHVNRKTNQNNTGIIKSSNLCVSGDTLILTDQGYHKIRELCDNDVDVWNGKTWSKTTVRQTGVNQKLIKISFSSNNSITCTEYHKFYIYKDDNNLCYEIQAKDLKIGMIISDFILPVINFKNHFDYENNDRIFRQHADYDTVKNIVITNIEDNNEYGDTYCVNEPLEHKVIFNGILTGNCAEIMEVSNKEETAVCNLASICLPKSIEYPDALDDVKKLHWMKLLNPTEKIRAQCFFNGKLKLLTTPNCSYCSLLKALLTKTNLEYEIIDEIEAEKLRIQSGVEKSFETYPQLFSVFEDVEKINIYHLGGYDSCWEVLRPRINYKKIASLASDLTVNLNKIIDKTYYPIEKTRTSNLRHRPIGIGCQGLADIFMMLRLPFTSDEAKQINKDIFESIYYGAMKSSMQQAQLYGSYSTFEGSPLSEGKFQFNLWGKSDEDLSGRWDWTELRENIKEYGVRNSLLIALMPTASSSSIFGNYESFETISSNLYTRNVLSGVFTIINKHLIKDLIELDLWTQHTKDRLLYDKGSVQKINGLPKFLKDVYLTTYEIDQKILIEMSADRGIFVCQSQSLNLFFNQPTFKDLTACHFKGWKLGLKTGSYYIRTKPALSGQNFGLDAKREKELMEEEIVEEECLVCSS